MSLLQLLECFLGLHEWIYFDRPEASYRKCEICNRLQRFYYDGLGGSWEPWSEEQMRLEMQEAL